MNVSVWAELAQQPNDVIPGMSLFFLLLLFLYQWECGRFVNPKGRWQPSEGGKTPSMKTQNACVGKSDSEANAQRKLLPNRTAHC